MPSEIDLRRIAVRHMTCEIHCATHAGVELRGERDLVRADWAVYKATKTNERFASSELDLLTHTCTNDILETITREQ